MPLVVIRRDFAVPSLRKLRWELLGLRIQQFTPVGQYVTERSIVVRNHLVARTGSRKKTLLIGVLLPSNKINKNVLLYRKLQPAGHLNYPIFTPWKRRVKALGQTAAQVIAVSGGSTGFDVQHYLGLSLLRFGGTISASSAPVGGATIPDAPTIGPATAGNAKAFVTFSAPGNDGGSPITGYTATSTPGSFTGTGTSPITVNGLTNGTNYTFTVHATNSVGNSVESAKSVIVTPNVPNAGAPTNLYMTLQGQTSPNSTTAPPAPQSPNSLTIVWDISAGASSYNVYRSVNGGGFTLYATNVLSNIFTDSAATNCVGSTPGSNGPPPVLNYSANTYQYKVTAIVGGVETAQSGTQSFVLYRNGAGPSVSGGGGWGGDFSFPNPGINVFVNYNDTVGDTNGCVSFTFNSAFAGFQPYVGNNANTWNLWSKAFNFLNFDLKPTIVGQTWNINTLRVGDVPIFNNVGGQTSIDVTTFGPAPVNGTWGTYKAPLTTILHDFGSNGAGPAVDQYAVYKFAIQDSTGNASGQWYMRNVYYSPT